MNRFLRFTPEAVYNTFATASSAKRFFPLDKGGNFLPLVDVQKWTIRHPLQNVPWLRGRETYTVAGNWSDRHYWENLDALLWLNRVNDAQTAPWTTDQRPRDLASASIEYAYDYFNRTLVRNRYTGMKVGESWELAIKDSPDDPFLNFNYALVGSRAYLDPISGDAAPDATAFPAPACESDYPNEPLAFWQMVFTYAGATLETFDEISIRGQHILTSHRDSKRYFNRNHVHGRTVTMTARIRLEASNNPRIVRDSQAALGNCKLTFTRPGGAADTLEISFRDNARVESVAEEHGPDADGYTRLTATAFLDCGDGDDFRITYTPA